MSLRSWLWPRLASPTPAHTPRPRLGVQRLEAREVPTTDLVSALGAGGSRIYDVAADAAGNSYVTGWFHSTVDLDPARTHPEDADVLTAVGTGDAFAAKYAPDGSLVWATRMGGDATDTPVDSGRAIALVPGGGVVVAGTWAGTGPIGPATLTSAGGGDAFVARLDAATGAITWAQRWGTDNPDESGGGVAADAAGNVYALGLRGAVYTSYQERGYEVRKFSPSGAPLWERAVRTGATEGDLAADVAGNVFVTGTFTGTVDLNPGTGRKDVYTASSADRAGFVLKLDSGGMFVWAAPFVSRTAGGRTGFSQSNSIALDGGGSVYVGGRYQGPVDFNPSSLAVTTLPYGPSQYAGGGFVTKLTPAGALTWARGLVEDHAAVSSNATVKGLATDAAGDVHAVGYYFGVVDFDPGAGTTVRLSTPAANGTRTNSDIFVLKLSAAGTYQWAEVFGGAGSDYAHGVAVDPAGVIHLAGQFQSVAVDFDPDPLATHELFHSGMYASLFLVRLRRS